MKKVIFMLLLIAVFAVSVQSSYADDMAVFPDGNMAIYLNKYDIDLSGYHLVIDLYNDNNVSAAVLDSVGNTAFYLYLTSGGTMYISYDGQHWDLY